MLLNLIYLVVAVIALPWVAWRRLSGGRPVAAPWTRFTGGIAPLPPKESARIWMHGVSVGEVQLLAALAAEIRRQAAATDRTVECVVSSSTTTGLDVAAKRFGADRVFPCPLDFTWAVRRVLDRVRPDMLLLGELELWPNLLAAAHARGIPIVVVNGRMSERSFAGYRRVAPLVRSMLGRTSLVIARSAADAERFRMLADCGTSLPEQDAIAIDPENPRRFLRSTKWKKAMEVFRGKLGSAAVTVAGSMKFDGVSGDRADPQVARLRGLAAFAAEDIVFLAGSTQAPEESLALETFRELAAGHPRLRLVIVPRHVERASEIASLLDASGVDWRRRSQLGAEGQAARVLLVDTTGELGWWWGTAAIAFVGGSLDGRRGGQNMLEPAAYGAAVCFGPHTRNFTDEVRVLLEAAAAEVVTSGPGLTAFVRRCLDDPAFAADRGRLAAATVAAHRGATAATAGLVLARLPAVVVDSR